MEDALVAVAPAHRASPRLRRRIYSRQDDSRRYVRHHVEHRLRHPRHRRSGHASGRPRMATPSASPRCMEHPDRPAVRSTIMTTSRWPWPDSMDGVLAAPDSHRVLFENEHTRVLEVTIAPGEREPAHTHRWPRVSWLEPEGPHSVENIDARSYGALRIELKQF